MDRSARYRFVNRKGFRDVKKRLRDKSIRIREFKTDFYKIGRVPLLELSALRNVMNILNPIPESVMWGDFRIPSVRAIDEVAYFDRVWRFR